MRGFMQTFHLGIDVAKAKLDCALRRPDGRYKDKVIENNLKGFKTLVEWIETQGAGLPHVCMEATGIYWEEVAEYLAAQGMTVSDQGIWRIASGTYQDRQGGCPSDCRFLF